MSLTKIGSIGINTGIQFAGVTTVSTLHVGSGVTLSSDGDIFATGISTFSDDVRIVDNKKILLGNLAAGDCQIIHDGTDTFIQNKTGDLKIANNVAGDVGGDIIIQAMNSEDSIKAIHDGAVELYHNNSKKFETSSSGATVTGTLAATAVTGDGSGLTNLSTDLVNDTSPQLGGNLDVNTKNITFGDSGGSTDDRLTFGAGTDLSIYHDGSHSFILDGGTGNLHIDSVAGSVKIRTNTNEDSIVCNQDGAVELYHDNSKKIETTSTGVSVTGGVAASGGNITLQDSGSATDDRVALGAGGDLQLFHDGTNSVIANQTGDFYIENDSSSTSEKVLIRAKAGESSINCNPNGSVELYYDDSKKVETNSTGINIVDKVIMFQGQGSRVIKYRDGENDMIYEGTSGFFMRQDIGNTRHEFFVGNSKKVSVTSDGLTFGSDTAAANALDDYEEGTYVPTISASGVTYTYGSSNDYTLRSPHSTSDSNTVSYVKIGSMVYLNFSMFWNSSNTIRYLITLPFTAKGSAYALCITPASFQVDIDGDILGTLGLGNNSTAFDTYRILKDTGTGGHGNVPLSASSEVYYQICYQAL